MSLRYLGLAAVLSMSLAACEGCEKKPETAGADAGVTTTVTTKDAATSAAEDAGAEAADAATAGTDAGTKHEMANCPTAVPGAVVAIKDVEGGVEVTVTAKDEATTSSIRERAKKLAAADHGMPDAGTKHDRSGSGGGTTGRCTIIMRGTDLTTADVAGGTKITVKAKDKAEVDWVRRETRDRDKEAKAAGAEGAGAQRMAHCPSAVEGAKTALKDTKEGVLVTVTGPADKVAEIRARAKHAAEVAKKPEAAKIEHTGAGTGGGGLGRCPIVVEGDTTVDVKEIEGGVEVDVKAKKDVPALQKEAKARAANFASK